MAERPDFPDLLESWEISLTADGKSASTIKTYLSSVRVFLAWCKAEGTAPALSRRLVKAWTASLLQAGAEPTTARIRQTSVRQFSKWCAEEGEIEVDDLASMQPPKLSTKVVPVLSDEELRAMIAACQGSYFRDYRDEAMIRLAVEAMLRSDELLSLDLDDVDKRAGIAVVRKGKGAKGRIVPFGATTGKALDRYLRARRRHVMAEQTAALWLGEGRGRMTYAGLRATLLSRAKRAGVEGFHPHRLRHTGVTRWLSRGGSEGALMTVAGWSSRSMIDRYSASNAAERAVEEARSLGLGDL